MGRGWPANGLFRRVSFVTIGCLSLLFEFAAYAQPFGNSPGTQCHLQHVPDHGRQVETVSVTKPGAPQRESLVSVEHTDAEK